MTVSTLVTLDPASTFDSTYATFTRHVVWTQYGIFVVYIHDTIPPGQTDTGYVPFSWHLDRSTDGGATFTTVYVGDSACRAPCIEADPNGVLYLVNPGYLTTPTASPAWDSSPAHFLRFEASNGFTAPIVTTDIPNHAAGKFHLLLDWPRRQLYWSNWGLGFVTLDLNGNILSTRVVTIAGPNGEAQYPLLALAENGDLYFAWSTVTLPQPPGPYPLRSGQVMMSKDAGETWQNLAGTALTLPIIGDDTGPSTMVTLASEFSVNSRLESMHVGAGKLHFVYYAAVSPTAVMHYVRYDLASGIKDRDVWPDVHGETIHLMNTGPWFSYNKVTRRLYLLAKNADNNATTPAADTRAAALYSDDNGDTWHDYVQSASLGPPSSNDIFYSPTGARYSHPNGSLYLMFTLNPSTAPVTQFIAFTPTALPLGTGKHTGAEVSWFFAGQGFQVLLGGPFMRTRVIEDVTPFGVVDQIQASAALRRINNAPMEILYDDAAGVDAVLQHAYLEDSPETLTLFFAPYKSLSVQANVLAYTRLTKVGATTRAGVVFNFTGPVQEV